MSKRSMSSVAMATATLGLLAALMAGRLAACSKSDASVKADPGASAAPAESADDQLSRKLGFYIECVNEIDPVVSDSREYYQKNLTEELKLNPARTPIVKTIGQYKLDKCFNGLAEAAKTAPKVLDVEDSGAAYQAALTKLEPLLVEADRYYDQKDFKDDGFARGNTLHPQILAGYQAFSAAHSRLHEAIDTHNDQILERALVRIEKEEGKTLRYYARRIMNDASALLDLATGSAPDPVKLRDGIEAFKTVYAEMLDRAAKNPAEVELIKNWSSFINDGDLVLGELKEIQRSINAQLAADKSKPVVIPDSPREMLIKRYNGMVEESNDLEFKSKE